MNEKRFEMPFDYTIDTIEYKFSGSTYILKRGQIYTINMKLGGVIINEYLGDDKDSDEILNHITTLTYNQYNAFINDIKPKLRNHIIDNILE